MERKYDLLHWIAIPCGLTAITVNIASDTQWMYEATGTLLDTNIAMIITIGVVGAVVLSMAMKGWQEKQIVSALAMLILWVACQAFSFGATAERVASARDASKQERDAGNPALVSAARAFNTAADKAKSSCDRLEVLEMELRTSPQPIDRSTLAGLPADEVKRVQALVGVNPDGRPGDRTLEAVEAYNKGLPVNQIGEARIRCELDEKRHREARVAYASVAHRADALGYRVEEATFGAIPARVVSIWHPLLAPLCLSIAGSVLFAWGAAGRLEKPEFDLVGSSPKIQLESKARRYALAFQQAHGRMPTPTEVANALDGVGKARARSILRTL